MASAGLIVSDLILNISMNKSAAKAYFIRIVSIYHYFN